MNLPFQKRVFDFIFSEGVLHHTPIRSPRSCPLNTPGPKRGNRCLHLHKKGPIREFCDDYLRRFTTRLFGAGMLGFLETDDSLWKGPLRPSIDFEIPEDIPAKDQSRGCITFNAFSTTIFLSASGTIVSRLMRITSSTFDWYHPTYAWRHTSEEVSRWCSNNKLETVWHLEEESGIKFALQEIDKHGNEGCRGVDGER